MTEGKEFSESGSTDMRNCSDAIRGAQRGVWPLLVLAILCLSLTACGSSGQETREGNASGAPAPKERAPGEGAVSRETTTKQSQTEVAATGRRAANRTFELPGGRTFPEGVAYDPASEDFFVGSS